MNSGSKRAPRFETILCHRPRQAVLPTYRSPFGAAIVFSITQSSATRSSSFSAACSRNAALNRSMRCAVRADWGSPAGVIVFPSCMGRPTEAVGGRRVSADRPRRGSCWWPSPRTPNPRRFRVDPRIGGAAVKRSIFTARSTIGSPSRGDPTPSAENAIRLPSSVSIVPRSSSSRRPSDAHAGSRCHA